MFSFDSHNHTLKITVCVLAEAWGLRDINSDLKFCIQETLKLGLKFCSSHHNLQPPIRFNFYFVYLAYRYLLNTNCVLSTGLSTGDTDLSRPRISFVLSSECSRPTSDDFKEICVFAIFWNLNFSKMYSLHISPFYNNISQVLYKVLKIFYEQFMNPNINVIIHSMVEFTYRLQGIKRLLTDSLDVGKWIYAKCIDKYI